MPNEVISCKYSLFDEGRTYTGHHRKYVLESAMAVCYAPETREGIRLREKLGYFGHGRRILAGKLAIGETEVVRLPTGQTILVENIPSNVTTRFEVHQDGTVEHDQEILLENEPGRTVLGLHRSRVGGFSWACAGQDGGAVGATRVTSFEGFDYVLSPGFAKNRGYVLESADESTRQTLLENIQKLGVKDPEKRLNDWILSAQLYADELQRKLEERAIYESSLLEAIDKMKAENETLLTQYVELKRQTDAMHETRARIIAECAREHVVVIPERVRQALLEMADKQDFYDLVAFFEGARSTSIDTLPIRRSAGDQVGTGGHSFSLPQSISVIAHPEYGTAAAGYDLDRPEWPQIMA